MSNRRIEQQLDCLNSLRTAAGDEVVPALRKGLADRVNVVIAKAAQVVSELGMRQLIPDLLSAFDRLFEKVERDPQCWGKTALAKALMELAFRESAPYLRGLAHVQMEAVWGGREDSATLLRGTCLLALVPCPDITREELLRRLVDRLAERSEKASTVRIESARALEQLEGEECILILRLKALLGDKEAAVIGQVLESLLRLDGRKGVPFVASFLDAPEEELSEEAALALGASQLNDAFDVLKSRWERTGEPVLLRALSLSRLDSSCDLLISIIETGRQRDAKAAIAALALRKDSAGTLAKVRQAVTNRNDEAVAQEFERQFSLLG